MQPIECVRVAAQAITLAMILFVSAESFTRDARRGMPLARNLASELSTLAILVGFFWLAGAFDMIFASPVRLFGR